MDCLLMFLKARLNLNLSTNTRGVSDLHANKLMECPQVMKLDEKSLTNYSNELVLIQDKLTINLVTMTLKLVFMISDRAMPQV